MTLRTFSVRPTTAFVLSLMLAGSVSARAQQASAESVDKDLAQSVRELQEQVQQLRNAVAEVKAEAAQYREQGEELRKQLENLRASSPSPVAGAGSPQNSPVVATSLEQRVASVEETSQLLQSELHTQYQTKVESASKYRLRLSGLVLFNMFSNHGRVDNVDFPTYATPADSYGRESRFGATLRQSEIGLEVFGPQLAGAKTSGQVQFDFGGGFPTGAFDGINTGLVRMRTATARLDWVHTSIIAGQDGLFISPASPTSFASLVIPSLGYSGNLWSWTPQIRVQHRVPISNDQNITIEGGFLDNVTGEPSYGTHRLPQAGESSGQPAYAARTSWNRTLNGRPTSFGVSGYYSRQNWGFNWNVNGWAAATDWRIPLPARLEFSGELYRGQAVGGLGGGIGQSVLFSGPPTDPHTRFLPLNSVGGWSQLKFAVNSRLEFNGAFGMDNPFSGDLHVFVSPVGPYQSVLTANRSGMANFIFRPRSDLLFSGEYRHLHTSEVGAFYTADQVNVMMGVLF